MIRILIIPALAALICFICACSGGGSDRSIAEASPDPKNSYQKITAEQAKSTMDEHDEYILLDVRTDEEFNEKHIEGAVLIPDYELRSRAETELPDKDALILVYCRSGRRSAIAAGELLDLGYTNILDFGGIIDWPYDIVSG